ncbi:DNA-binding protein [Pseudaminobacter arsenicus]|uniref:DNA-binding protein n=1 Tax=Borborobacter arsenicus TaxID=1851146 RepID=A0A432V0D9_9HYPH|nr:helix-turn-helix domain-containing protein [Pseudaminobacter arsenicus]RUM95512.1 DNA-binding protein [Pseudaminobacter arsenicus]
MEHIQNAAEPASPLPKLAFSIPEFCAMFGVGRSTVYDLMKAGELRSAKIKGKTIFTKKEVDRFAAKLEGEDAA